MPDTNPNYQRRIAQQLIISVILFSTVITLISSSLQLYGDYRQDIKDINTNLYEISTIHLNNVSRAVWIADYQSVNSIINGLINLPSIAYLEVYEESKQVASIGALQTHNFVEQVYPLNYEYKGRTRTIGKLRVQASLDNIYHALINKAIVILISNGIKTFLVSGFLLYLFYYLVTRHLQTLARYASRMSVTNLHEPLTLQRKANNHEPDELDIVLEAINNMRENLLQSITVLQESEQRYRSLIETTTAIPWEYSLESGQFTYVGPQAIGVLGFPLEKWREPNFRRSHIHPEDRVQAITAFETIVNETKEGELEYRFLDANERYVDIREHVKVISLDGKDKSVSGFMFDITQKKAEHNELLEYRESLEDLVKRRTEELQLINTELEAFSYSVSHDLRAPLRAIFGFSQALREDFSEKLDDTAQNYLERVQKASLRMGHIIDDLLRLSRISRKQLQVENIDLADLAKSALEQLELMYEGTPPKLTILSPLPAKGDRGLLSVVMENLLSNAWKYSNPKQMAEITLGRKLIQGENVYYISDNGLGFDMRFYEKLFSVFQRLHSEDHYEGSGIGLATVQRIIKRHGGKIWAESELNKGSTFYFTLKPSISHENDSDDQYTWNELRG